MRKEPRGSEALHVLYAQAVKAWLIVRLRREPDLHSHVMAEYSSRRCAPTRPGRTAVGATKWAVFCMAEYPSRRCAPTRPGLIVVGARKWASAKRPDLQVAHAGDDSRHKAGSIRMELN